MYIEYRWLCNGEVAERLKALVLKTSNGFTHSWVRIPPSPPVYLYLKSFNNLDILFFGIDFSWFKLEYHLKIISSSISRIS